MATPTLYRRATGPRVKLRKDYLGDPTVPVCPWCKTECEGVSHTLQDVGLSEHAVAACPSCHKEFMWPGRDGDPVSVGLISPADWRYLVSRGLGKPLHPSEIPF